MPVVGTCTLTRKQIYFLKSSGNTLPEVLVALLIISISAMGLGTSLMQVRGALKRSEAVAKAIQLESDLIGSFNNSSNYPVDDPTAPNTGVRYHLRQGDITTLSLTVPLPEDSLTASTTITVGVPGLTGIIFFNSDGTICSSCTDFSTSSSIMSLQVGLQKQSANPPKYVFSYEINFADQFKMKKIGDILKFDVPIDPANYRVADIKTSCNIGTNAAPGPELFLRGVNRDTGEAICASTPVNRCPVATYPKGLQVLSPAIGKGVAGENSSVELLCTGDRNTPKCDAKYSLWSFDPKYSDPDVPAGNIGKCIYSGSDNTAMWTANGTQNRLPSNTTAAWYIRATQTCPPDYLADAGQPSCVLYPETVQNGICYAQDKTGTNYDQPNTCDLACSPVPYSPVSGCDSCTTNYAPAVAAHWGPGVVPVTPCDYDNLDMTAPDCVCGGAHSPGPGGPDLTSPSQPACAVWVAATAAIANSGCTNHYVADAAKCGTTRVCTTVGPGSSTWLCPAGSAQMGDTTPCRCWSTYYPGPIVPGVISTALGPSGITCKLNNPTPDMTTAPYYRHTRKTCAAAGYPNVPPNGAAQQDATWYGGVQVDSSCHLDPSISASPFRNAHY